MLELEEEFTVEKEIKVPKSQRFRRNYTSDYHKVNGEYPTTWARRVFKKYVNQPYEEAFAYFCTLVPDYQQKWFKSEFDVSRGWWTPYDQYTLDEDNIIRVMEKKQKKGPVTFESFDYKIGYKSKKSGSIIVPKNNWDTRRIIKDYPGQYVEVVISGYIKEFESDKDREYIRLMKEKAKLKNLDKKNKKKEKQKIAYSFLTKEEVQRKAEISTDLIKVKKHGFDKESFRGIEYHGQKRKLKTAQNG